MTRRPEPGLSQDHAGSHANVRPKGAATLILLRRKGTEIEFLMGRRSQRHVFMPGMFVFPGGRIDRADLTGPRCSPLDDAIVERIAGQSMDERRKKRAHALALCGIRETYEETGLLLGEKETEIGLKSRHPSWHAFRAEGITPSLAPLRLIARAITPPRRSRRFDTWFFAAFDDQIAAHHPAPNDELESLDWLSPGMALTQDIPLITRLIIADLVQHLERDPNLRGHPPIPFYRMLHGKQTRELL